MTKIALFGTSADPPTAAHKVILRWLSDHYDWVAIWASDNPFKSHQTPLEHRKQMLRLVISELETSRNNVGLHEELSSPRSLETVEKAGKIWGTNVEFNLVIGSDLVSQLPRWHRVEDLLRKVKLLVVPRPGYPVVEDDLEKLRYLGGRYAIADFNVPAVSSTAYREKGNSDVVTQPVEDYIHREQLYVGQNAAKTPS